MDMGRLMRALTAFLADAGWPFYPTNSPRHRVIPLPETSSCSQFIVEVREELGQVLVFTMAWMSVPPEKREMVDYYIGRVNSQCALGSFDFDIDEGLVAYRTGVEVGATALTPELIRPLFAYGFVATERHVPVIMDLVDEKITLAEAVRTLDGDDSGRDIGRTGSMFDGR